MTTILLARHGETDWNRDNRFQGHADPPLNAAGREQARALAAALAAEPLTAVYTSPLRRAAETAEMVAAGHGLPAHADEALREIDVGSWEGFTRAELEARSPVAVARWDAHGERGWEGGESHQEMLARVRDSVRSIAERHDGEKVLVVAHGGPIRALKALAAGLDYPRARRLVPRTLNGEVFAIAVRDGAVRGLH